MGMAFLGQKILAMNLIITELFTYSASAGGLGSRFSGSKICAVDFTASVGMAFLLDRNQYLT